MYSDDSFHTLTGSERRAVIALGILVVVPVVMVLARAVAGRPTWQRIAIALAAFWLFVWLAPQAYYTLYVFMLGVPWQTVIGWPPGPVEIVQLLTFTGPANLSFHSQGVLGWVLLAIAAFRKPAIRSAV